MKRWTGAALWLAPVVLCFALYWPGLAAWFQADDFAWLKLARSAGTARQVVEALFTPQAQGTFRVLSERAYFLVFYNLFGLDALPYRLWIFLTQAANLLLLASIARRLTGSRAAAFWAAVFWIAGAAFAIPLTWAAVYNQVLCAFFFLAAFRLLLLHIDTGRARYYWAQWAAFVLGFGALEVMVVYPAVAGAYTWIFSRRHFRRVLPMFVASFGYTAANRTLAPPASGLYAMHFDASVFRTVAAYWKWAAGPGWLASLSEHPPNAWIWVGVAAMTAAAGIFVYRRARVRDWLPAFCLLLFFFVLAPYLPLAGHVSDYYLILPTTGTALLGGYAMARAWRPAAAAAAAVYLGCSIPAAIVATRYFSERSLRTKSLVLGVGRAVQLHPHKAILLTDVDSELFFTAVLDDPFPLAGASRVYLTPDAGRRIHAIEGIGDPAPWILPAAAAKRALATSTAVVYSAAGARLKNITSTYRVPAGSQEVPRRVDAANPLLEYLLGSGWHENSGNHRFMAKRATLRIGGGKHLLLTGTCVAPVEVMVSADGSNLGSRRVGEGSFALEYALPAAAASRGSVEIAVEVSRTIRPPEDGRDLGLAFGTFEVR
jgi:hypothetical protein